MKSVDKPGLYAGVAILAVGVWCLFAAHIGWGVAGVVVGLLFIGASVPQSEAAADGPTDWMKDARVLDFRPDWEKEAEREAQADLGGEDEQCARTLCALLADRDEAGARGLGEQLFASGGHRRMVRVCLRVKALGGDARTLERRVWDGVGQWMG